MTRWMAGKAEELNVDIFPGFAASSVLYGRQGEVAGVATGDVGIAKDGTRKDTFARGTELRAKLTLFGEGCRGSLSEVIRPPAHEYLLQSSPGNQPCRATSGKEHAEGGTCIIAFICSII